jgi:hypothetical protein
MKPPNDLNANDSPARASLDRAVATSGSAWGRIERAAIVLLFAFPVFYFAGPALPRFCGAILGLPGDGIHNLWSAWHVANATLLRDEPMYSTMRLLAPVGATLTMHTLCLLPSMLVAPVTQWISPYAGYNLLIVMAQLWAGFGAFMLVRRLTGSTLSGAFAAFVMESSPILFHRLVNHFSLAYMGFIPLLIERLLAGAEKDDPAALRRHGLATGGIAIACFLTDYNLCMLSIFSMGVFWVALAVAALIAGSRERLGRLAFLALWPSLVFGVFLYAWACFTPLQDARFWWHDPPTALGRENNATGAYYLIPDPESWSFAQWLPASARETRATGPERFNFLGLTCLALCGLGAVALAKRRRAVLAAMLLLSGACLDLSLGYGAFNPLHGGAASGAPSPFLLFPKLEGMPLLGQFRVPARWALPLMTCVVAGAGCGFHWILQKLHRPALRLAALAFFCGLAFVEFAHKPTPVAAFPLPDAYRAIGTAQDPRDMIVELPINIHCGEKGPIGPSLDPERMAWSMEHGYRIVSCYLSRISYDRIVAVLNQPLIRDLWTMQGGSLGSMQDGRPTDLATVKRWIALNHARYIVINKRMNYIKIMDYLRAGQIASPIAEDDAYIVLETSARKR